MVSCSKKLDSATREQNKRRNPNKVVWIRQATKEGWIPCILGGVVDLSYPNSKTRRGRVQENGTIAPTITTSPTSICRIEIKKEDDKNI